MGDYRILKPGESLIDFDLGRPEGHVVVNNPLENDKEIVNGELIPLEKIAFAVKCQCGIFHPIVNNVILWGKEFSFKWEISE